MFVPMLTALREIRKVVDNLDVFTTGQVPLIHALKHIQSMARTTLEAEYSPEPPAPGSRWGHVKNADYGYTVIGISLGQCASRDPLVEAAPYVVYQGDNGMVFHRPLAEFLDGRFTLLDPTGTA